MSISLMSRKRILFVLFLFMSVYGMAQNKGVDQHGNPITSYYIDITSTIPQKTSPYILDANDSSLDIQYHDHIGKSNVVNLRLLNWKREQVAVFQLQKEFGLNFFQISLKKVSPGMITDQVYTIEMKDEQGKLHTALLKWKVPELAILTMNVMVNPQYLECAYEVGNSVEFYGELSGGKSPYTITWYVMNDTRTDLLYQPRVERNDNAGKTASIIVDKSPDYYVLVRATDACGQEVKRTVHLTCEEGKKKINSLFISPLDPAGMPVKAGN